MALHYGARSRGVAPADVQGRPGLLDAWLVDTVDADAVPAVEDAGVRCRAIPLMMTDTAAAEAMAREALRIAGEVSGRG